MPVVLVLIGIILLGSASGIALIMLSVFLVMRPGRGRGKLMISLLLLAFLLAVSFGGGLVLTQLGLSWRRWVQGVLLLAVGATFLMMVYWVNREVESRQDAVPWMRGAVSACSLCVVLATVLTVGASVFFGTWSDRVVEGNEWTDQKAVVEVTGIFRETGYRYVNFLIKGEKIYEWED
ncbi:hypothetical protein DWX58_09090 [Pseudoflavonifractor sp. AF19-9AC]|uniref:hypothetical protein n=1 Tax=Pseudoflavonifractor sp. AF19-9AC TaxID=2292244 RepID=UPI000E4C034C|nr:hypothetical protein [Pseudoflavonifractor sp. AF19-9AC]RHR09054.1 hypothetical protein DWX58_09090 [Pseudoflavonifractor sp. AF19-9AC]